MAMQLLTTSALLQGSESKSKAWLPLPKESVQCTEPLHMKMMCVCLCDKYLLSTKRDKKRTRPSCTIEPRGQAAQSSGGLGDKPAPCSAFFFACCRCGCGAQDTAPFLSAHCGRVPRKSLFCALFYARLRASFYAPAPIAIWTEKPIIRRSARTGVVFVQFRS